MGLKGHKYGQAFSRSKWLRTNDTFRSLNATIKRKLSSEEKTGLELITATSHCALLNDVHITNPIPHHPKLVHTPPPPSSPRVPQTKLTNSQSDIPSSVLWDLSPQVAEQLNCPIFDLELGPLLAQDDDPYAGDTEESMFIQPNLSRDISKMDFEGFQDLKKYCSQNSISSLHTPTIDDDVVLLDVDDFVANSSAIVDSENILKDQFFDFATSESQFYQFKTITTSTDTVDNTEKYNIEQNIVYSNDNSINYDTPSVQVSYPDYEEEVVIGQTSSVCSPDSTEVTNFYVYSDVNDECVVDSSVDSTSKNDISFINYDNVDLNMDVSSSTNVDQQSNWLLLNNVTQEHSLDYDEIAIEEDIQATFPALDMKNNNDQVIDDVIIYGNYDFDSNIKKNDKGLKLDCTTAFNVSELPNNVSTPDVFKTVELLENDQTFTSGMSLYNNNYKPTQIDSLKLKFVKTTESDYSYTLTPPDTPKSKITKRKRSSQCDDSDYELPVKKTKPDVVPLKKGRKSASFEIDNLHFQPVKLGRPSKSWDTLSPRSSITDDVASPDDMEHIRRIKNNLASKRSRYNKKVKMLEMENLADDLESRNSKLRIELGALERKTTRLRSFLFEHMTKT